MVRPSATPEVTPIEIAAKLPGAKVTREYRAEYRYLPDPPYTSEPSIWRPLPSIPPSRILDQVQKALEEAKPKQAEHVENRIVNRIIVTMTSEWVLA
jgi:hypothetical protein